MVMAGGGGCLSRGLGKRAKGGILAQWIGRRKGQEGKDGDLFGLRDGGGWEKITGRDGRKVRPIQ